jgi:maintenance of morphology protein 1
MQPETFVAPQVLELLKSHLTDITCTRNSTLSFVKGFVLGQLSVIVVVVLVLRYLFTEDVKSINKVHWECEYKKDIS